MAVIIYNKARTALVLSESRIILITKAKRPAQILHVYNNNTVGML